MHKEILIPLSVIALSIIFLDPFMVLMPPSLVYFFILLLLLSSIAYALLVWREVAIDEREYIHRAYAGRVSFIAGVILLVCGMIYQVLILHEIDPFLVVALSGMTIAKYIGYKYVQNKF